jgi:hypothetical protein
MIKVVIENKHPVEVLCMVYDLRTQGLQQGKDFDFAFHQSRWDEMIGEIPRQTVFTFYTEKYATLFTLKYSS